MAVKIAEFVRGLAVGGEGKNNETSLSQRCPF